MTFFAAYDIINATDEKGRNFLICGRYAMHEFLLEPLKYYERVGKQEHAKNTEEYFDKLLKESRVDAEQNRATVKAYNKAKAAAEKVRTKLRKKKVLRVFLILGIVLCGVLAIVASTRISSSPGWGVGLCAVGVCGLVGGIVLLVKKLNPAIRSAGDKLEEHLKKAGELLAEAEAQMAPLNAMFDNTDALRLIEKTIPELIFDDRYSVEQEKFFVNSHDFVDREDLETSMTNTLSGRFAGNPFLFCDTLAHEMGTATYHGTLLISWTETYRDSDGRIQTRRRTQTLHASVVKPKPEFRRRNYLCYGCQAAPDLTFSRSPQHSERLSEKEIDRKVQKGMKRLKKKAEKATKKGGDFQEMANSEFDVLFGADDRDQEVQFRLMYTPLAQCNTVDLLTSKTGYGDDFYFRKSRRFNVVTSEHAQGRSITVSTAEYYSYDVDEAKRKFLAVNADYFKSLFFDFAPLWSVPAYLEEPCAALEPIEDTERYYTDYEHEVMANALGGYAFAHEDTATNAILKTRFLKKSGAEDCVEVTAYSYAAADRVDFIPVFGGDGRMHPVPVHWVEYIPLEKQTEMRVGKAPVSERELRSAHLVNSDKKAYFHGMAARIL